MHIHSLQRASVQALWLLNFSYYVIQLRSKEGVAYNNSGLSRLSNVIRLLVTQCLGAILMKHFPF